VIVGHDVAVAGDDDAGAEAGLRGLAEQLWAEELAEKRILLAGVGHADLGLRLDVDADDARRDLLHDGGKAERLAGGAVELLAVELELGGRVAGGLGQRVSDGRDRHQAEKGNGERAAGGE